MLPTRFNRSGTFTEREVVALPAYGELVREVEQMIDHHRRASIGNDFTV